MYEYDDRHPHLDIIEIKQLKKCIYEGYKLNIAKLVDNEYYTMNTHVPIKVRCSLINESIKLDNFKQTKPKQFIYSDVMLSGSDKFVFNVGSCISIIDGFINIDNSFIMS